MERVRLDGAGLEILDREECLRLLAPVAGQAGTGRVALTVRALPAILPVRFVLDHERIVIRTGTESTLAVATRSAVVAFEADGRDGPGGEWSVVATGLASHVTDDQELVRLASLPLPHWADGGCLVSITTDRLGGRRTRTALPS
jgi:nitroimidazol reductase NimA-like FMN-containing flavoprotein (pyridoxamine 5'-phosphate oxidase superfamily)